MAKTHKSKNNDFTSGHRRVGRLLAMLVSCASLIPLSINAATAKEVEAGDIILTPDVFLDEENGIVGIERGLIFVPENRQKEDSRLIAVHFQRIPAISSPKNPTDKKPPIFLLPGGPGSDYKFNRQSRVDYLNLLRQTRDVIAVSQRGNPSSPGLVPNFGSRYDKPAPLDKPGSVATQSKRMAKAYGQALAGWKGAGVDIEGYDIINIVDDVNDLRKALGYDKIFLRGCSFGSQWSFSYIKRWPETVEKAMLSGVEPLDFAYDSSKWLWASMARLAVQAEADPDLAPSIPEGGLMKALETVITRLKEKPVTVSVVDPRNGGEVDVTLGADDLRLGAVRYFSSFRQGSDLKNLAVWPHFILDMYEGDYRALAMMALFSRRELTAGILIGPLIDNSLGISDARDELLANEKERDWIDANWFYRSTRTVKAAPEVDPSFRDDYEIDTPILLVSGDWDWSTPIENAEYIEPFLKMGKLVTVEGATHCPLGEADQAVAQAPEMVSKLHEFIDGDFKDDTALASYLDSLPDAITLKPLDFAGRDGMNVYDLMLKSGR
ncbi:MAG: alpha/beta hydrolase [Pseudomonadota bacterium]